MLAVLNAVTGASEILTSPGGHSWWFATLSDRDPTLKGCPGGSSARVPFGVLTRDEEAYAVRNPPVTAMVHLQASVELKLTTVPALNRADPGLYGGCVQQSCSIDELVWPTIAVIHAPGGRTLSCPPPWESTPPGGRTDEDQAVLPDQRSGQLRERLRAASGLGLPLERPRTGTVLWG